MAIETDRNTSYGGPAVTQKYSPLRDIAVARANSAECSALLINRANVLANLNVLPQALFLTTDWHTNIAAVSGHDPPLVVISSNRSKWIAAGVEAARKQWAKKKFETSNDLNALTALDRQKQSPPLYVPQRTEGDRKVFIVVHMYEYNQYRLALADSGMTVVGWSFKTPATATKPLTGFGASRYAAIEFCKHLRAKMAGVKWDYAWLLDDNLVGLTNFPGYGPVETAISAGTTERICAAFQGSSQVESHLTIQTWADAEVTAGRAKPTVLPTPAKKPGVIQQVALWNIKYLTNNNLNFSPLFVSGGEDVSFGNYLNLKKIPYLYYAGIRARKEVVPVLDETPGATDVNSAKEFYAKLFAAEEAITAAAGRTPPPPVQVEPSDRTDGRVQTLSHYITTWFTTEKKAPKLIEAADKSVQEKAKCQAVEQIVCEALEKNIVTADALNRTFKMHGDASQYVKRYPPPA